MERTLKHQPSQNTQVNHPLWLRVYAALCSWQRNVRTRSQLARLDCRQLADAGITEAQRQAELAKPFWR
ncbi:MAG: hypothetical protein CVV09_10730 [Gammaproteobacteria bacterium HGW-Gammaproteobacteria-13]|uniref:DUF1127 domain-containing protein n=1 Tax=Pseudomonas sp. TaxID=306 RepID=UPI000CBC095D|nr:DUF1127 domain-containing protein [Pseudomonas sp.]MDP2748147.1 DUF1127 domain-containing protein [Pseudomonas sp.]PKM25910.1 MAG: hypothetical protein CVV09_10730 [Gammaproteobacteria bacterium HGW-Gammaproteobacteria-13]